MYGPLKEVVLGWEDNMRLHELTPEKAEIYGAVAGEARRRLLLDAGGRTWGEAHPEYVARLVEEREALRGPLRELRGGNASRSSPAVLKPLVYRGDRP